MIHRAAFVDRDGVVNALTSDPVSGYPESPLRPDDVSLLTGAAAALREIRNAGWLLVGVSNQPAAAKGKCTLETLGAVQARVLALLDAEGVQFDDFRLCPHHPNGVVPELTCDCECRKPNPGMLLAAARDCDIDLSASWMIGDTDGDVEAGTRAGCRTVLLDHEPSAHKRSGRRCASARAADLAAAAAILLSL